MNGKRRHAVGLMALLGLGPLLQVGCSQPLDLCGDAPGTCLTVQASADTTDPVDLLRAIYTVGADSQKELQFMSPPGGSPLPAGFVLHLTDSGPVDLQVIAEQSLRPMLRGSAQLTIDGGTHQQVTVTLTANLDNLPYFGPPPRHHAGMVYAPSRGAVVLFGGIGSDDIPLGDTWEFSAASGVWSAHGTSGPTPLARNATLAYDPSLSRVVLAGGTDVTMAAVQDLWFYDAQGSWSQAPANHGGGSRTAAGLTVTDDGVVVVAGGIDASGTILQDVQTFDPTIVKNGPEFIPHTTVPLLPRVKTPKLVSSSMPALGEVYLLGADEDSPNAGVGVWQIKGLLSVSGSTLAVLAVDANDQAAPTRRTDFAVTSDTAAGLIYLFGGTDLNGMALQDAYVFSIVNKQWAKVSATATPAARAGAQLALLPPTVMLMGGQALSGSALPLALDNWRLTTDPFTGPTLPGVFLRRP